MTNNLAGVLLRFRKEAIAFTCDIEGMFFQVKVDERHRNCLRFLWWENADTNQPPTEYRMTTHLFGATSSPACANFALKTAADMNRSTFGDDAADFIKNDFYVDDGLKSVPTAEEAIQMIASSSEICEIAGFNLHKFLSNSKTVLSTVPIEKRAKNVQNIDIFKEELPLEHTLGVQWYIELDTLQFRVRLTDKPTTRRGILSTISSIFDPLGLVLPVLLKGKLILQRLCIDKCSWDDPVPEDAKASWERWKSDLLNLAKINVQRNYKPEDFGEIRSTELHHFSDACLHGYGQCSYLRLTDHNGKVCTALVMAKSRVAPSKPITIPRLELVAAVTSAEVAKFLQNEMKYSDATHYFYTDSKVVLGYVTNEAKRFHIFVANRVQKIRDSTSPKSWNYVSSSENLADIASRGTQASELVESAHWWNGPAFLATADLQITSSNSFEIPSGDPEIKETTVLKTKVSGGSFASMEERFQTFSSWFNLKRAVAICLRFKDDLMHRRVKKPKSNSPSSKKSVLQLHPVNKEEMKRAETNILKKVQERAYKNELKQLAKPSTSGKGMVDKESNLYCLDPLLDQDGAIRVGGRIKESCLSEELKHPILVPEHSHVSKLLIDHHHQRMKHAGRGMTLNDIRQSGYWIIKARKVVASHIMKCVQCRRLRGASCTQRMSDLPTDRGDPSPPFSFSAVDYFGPFLIREGRKEVKRWGVLFTCMASRAIHVETANMLTTDSFLNAYRRFVGRRGPIQQLRSDRGTNFIGGKNELTKALEEMDNAKISKELLKDNCDWISFRMNFPHSSHMGGAWERMIKSVRSVLSAILQKNSHQLDDELFRTFLVEAETIVNSRPLTYVDTTSSDSPVALSPMQILTLKSKVVLPPPGVFVREDLYCRRRWRRVQYLADQFWAQWKTEYLPQLQERTKWNKAQRNLQKNDVVLMMDETAQRNQWPLGRIMDTYPSADGRVRKVQLKDRGSLYDRPVHKLILLMTGDSPSESQ